mmetsp:Transcript_42091/g.120823  ORF Transcript_42091/g.120823 Transcript_42091/m.120823 type:complete len:297 (-) Transcript_42091:3334-4224(-)
MDLRAVLVLDIIWERQKPRVQHRHPPQICVRLQEHDADPRHSRWRCVVQIPDLEQHRGDDRQLDDLAAVEAQLLVIVQHRVHVLDPDGVHGPVEHDPLAPAVAEGLRGLAHGDRQHAVCPLLRVQVGLAVQLPLGDGLGVNHVLRDGHVGIASICQLRQRLREHVLHVRLPARRDADRHQPVANEDGLPQLYDFRGERSCRLETILDGHVTDDLYQLGSVTRWQLHAREQVADDTLEERQVGRGKLRQVDVSEGAQRDDILRVLIPVLTLAVAAGDEQRVQAAHAEVVVLLWRELL